MRLKRNPNHSLEILEARIAPATTYASILDAQWVNASAGTSGDTGSSTFELKAGQGLKSGTQYFMFVEKGNALVFATDIDNDSVIDYHEITGIAAGDGLRLISFVDIHGDIITNLIETPLGNGGTVLTLSDSDNNPTNDLEADGRYRGDGRVVLNKTIEKIELRSLTEDDLRDENGNGSKADELEQHETFTSYSIYGNIYAGKGFGAADGGLIVDSSAGMNPHYASEAVPSIGSIMVGTSVSGQYYSFGVSNRNDWHGVISTFVPPVGQSGGFINGLKTAEGTPLNINGLIAGNGGIGAAGGDISNILMTSDDSGGYYVIAGNGGSGLNGGVGGSILNFSDTGSATGKVIIKTGDGGTGTAGNGGNAGNSSFGTLNLRGNMVIQLGDGGDGFKKGGNGAILSGGLITNPGNTEPEGLNGTGVTHYPSGASGSYTANIGSHLAVDFNGDGFGDWVTTTVNPSQIIVSLGDGEGGFLPIADPYGEFSDYGYFLSGVRNPDAMVVADLNADGRPDIAVGSSDIGQQAGVVVYLSKYEDLNGDGTLDGNEDLDGDQINDFIGFYEGRFSPVAGALLLTESNGPNEPGVYIYVNIMQINDIVAGDFNGDGIVELVVQGYMLADGTTPNSITYGQGLAFMQPDTYGETPGKYTGQFYTDHGTRGSISPPVPAAPLIPMVLLPVPNDHTTGELINTQVTALSTLSTFDSIIVGYQNTSDAVGFWTYRYFLRAGETEPELLAPFFEMGAVDTVRGIGLASMEAFILHDYSILDFDADNLADVVAISKLPAAFMIGIKGDGLGGGSPDSGTGDDAGNFFSTDPILLGITTGSYDGGFLEDNFAIAINSAGQPTIAYDYVSGFDAIIPIDLGGINGPWQYDPESPSMPLSNMIIRVSDISTTSIGVGAAEGQGIAFPFLVRLDPLPAPLVLPEWIDYPTDSLILSAGDGGNSLTGQGGTGGFLGSGIKEITVTTVVDDGDDDETNDVTVTEKILQGKLDFIMNIPLALIAGDGGNGFSRGGDGGTITGVTTLNTPNVTLTAGIGGRGVAGAGGDGGSLIANSIDNGSIFTAGAGGVGRTGGNGGSVIGINKNTYYDTYRFGTVLVEAGAGGYGTRGGGNGGNITNFIPNIQPSGEFLADPDVHLTYIAGNGGNSVSGVGGKGGSITDSSPIDANGIDGDIYILAGNGGGGTVGGAGGNIINFVHNPSAFTTFANIISILAGNGGAGISGNGGAGGDIRNLVVPTNGSFAPVLTNFDYNRVIAGNGGASSAARGGDGGAINGVDISSGEISTAIVGGAGGHGLTGGGIGGSVNTVTIEPGASTFVQALIVGGAGGNASAFVANPLDTTPLQGRKAFGGKVGLGGAGGSIIGVTQDGASQPHLNLISGNGGDTLHYGTILDPKVYVGTGGSIKNVDVDMDIGNVTGDNPNTPTDGNPLTVDDYEAVPIKSYNNIFAGETMAMWVQDKMRPATDPLALQILNDADGNVGIVVGAAGRNKPAEESPGVFESTPANNARNGDLVDIRAKNLLSAVAGSVDRIAAIDVVRGLNIAPGTVGAEKDQVGEPAINYYEPDGITPTSNGEPTLEGRLFDGAIVAHNFYDLAGNPITIQGKVFKR